LFKTKQLAATALIANPNEKPDPGSWFEDRRPPTTYRLRTRGELARLIWETGDRMRCFGCETHQCGINDIASGSPACGHGCRHHNAFSQNEVTSAAFRASMSVTNIVVCSFPGFAFSQHFCLFVSSSLWYDSGRMFRTLGPGWCGISSNHWWSSELVRALIYRVFHTFIS